MSFRISLRRLAAVITTVLLLWFLTNTLEIRRTAYSCRTVWSCLGIGTHTSYSHPQTPTTTLVETQTVLHDGTTRYDLVNSSLQPPTLLILVLTKDSSSWSSDFRSQPRSIHDFLSLLSTTGLEFPNVSLALTTSSESHFATLKSANKRLPLGRLTLFLRPDVSTGVSYTDRHAPAAQLARRSAIASMRNHLMLSALQDEAHILWLDADIVELSPGIIQRMLQHSATNADAGIVTAECRQNQMDDVNAAQLRGAVSAEDGANAVEELVATRAFVPELIRGTSDDGLVALDSVGGTILYIRADLVKQGVTFPLQNIVGTTWDRAGWIGVETEGICYVARAAKGGGCYVLGGSHFVRHTDWG
nr:mannan polymerase complex subunit mnn9 [Quercus suber]